MSHNVEGITQLKDPPQQERTYYLWAVTSIEDLESCLDMHPHGILNLGTKKQTWFRNPYLLVNSPTRIPNSSWTILKDGFYEIKTFEPRTYYGGNRSAGLWFFQDCPTTDVYRDNEPRTQCVRNSGTGGGIYAGVGQSAFIPYPQHFVITGVSLTPMPGTCRKNYANLVGATRFRFFIGTRDFVYVPTVRVAGEPGEGSRGDMRSKICNPMAPILTLPEPVDIIPLQTFFVELVPFETFTIEEPVKIFLNFHGNFEQVAY
jgi:hypothetical protein